MYLFLLPTKTNIIFKAGRKELTDEIDKWIDILGYQLFHKTQYIAGGNKFKRLSSSEST